MPAELPQLLRSEGGRILASLLMICRDVDTAEDALQDALLQATEQWSLNPPPTNKAGWLLTVARRRLIDRIRKENLRHSTNSQQAIRDRSVLYSDDFYEEDFLDNEFPDERLRLIFTCCHPALSEDARVPLTLKTLCGLSVREIARAFLLSEAAMNQRLTRAKRKIRDAGIAYEVPEGKALEARLSSVLSVIYLIYNESYSAYESQTLTRDDLANEAIHLARLLHKLLPQPEVAGLLCLLLLHDARRPARTTKAKEYIPLEQHERNLWNKEMAQEGTTILQATLAQGKPGPYQIQAAISALHSNATSWEETDWQQIQLLYQTLYCFNPSPVIALNRYVALANFGDIEKAAKGILALAQDLDGYQPYYVAKADIEIKLGKLADAICSLGAALTLTKNEAERRFLEARKAELEGPRNDKSIAR